jgi:hypothetical protein
MSFSAAQHAPPDTKKTRLLCRRYAMIAPYFFAAKKRFASALACFDCKPKSLPTATKV